MGRAIDMTSADGLAFVAVRGRALTEGFYLARRRTWAAEHGWRIVYVFELENDGRTLHGVFQVGADEPEDPRKWLFRSRLMGLEHLPANPPPHPRVQLADVVH